MKHDPGYGEEVLSTSGSLLRQLCPDATLVRCAIVTWRARGAARGPMRARKALADSRMQHCMAWQRGACRELHAARSLRQSRGLLACAGWEVG